MVITRLEFVAILLERLQIADSVVTRAGLERVTKCQSSERGVAAGASAPNDQTIPVCFAVLDEIARAIHAVVDVHHSPLPIQAAPVFRTVACAAAVVHVQYAEAAARPI